MSNTNTIINKLYSIKKRNNVGKKWTKECEKMLLNYISENKSLDDISVLLQRNNGGILARLKKIAINMHSNGYTLDEITKTCKFLTNDDLLKITGECKSKNNMDDINTTLQMILMLKLIKNDYDYDEIRNLSNDIFHTVKIDNSTQTDEKDFDDVIFGKKILKKMKKYKNDKHKLKELRKKYHIKYDIFYDKLHSL